MHMGLATPVGEALTAIPLNLPMFFPARACAPTRQSFLGSSSAACTPVAQRSWITAQVTQLSQAVDLIELRWRS
jgi:hypothetical protein